MDTVIGSGKTRALRVLWMLEELGLPYRHVACGPRSPEAQAASPGGKLPVLETTDADGTVHAITDSTAILTYLADRERRLTAPAGSLARARQDAATQRILDEVDALLWTAARHSFVLPAEQRVPDVKPSLRWEFARNAAGLAKMLGEGPFVCGADVSVPDIILAHCMQWAGAVKFEADQPALADHLARMQARPAYAAAVARG